MFPTLRIDNLKDHFMAKISYVPLDIYQHEHVEIYTCMEDLETVFI
jgi:hypothetical protein